VYSGGMKTVDYYNVRMKVKITIKRLVAEKRQNATLSKFAKTKDWLKHVVEKGWQIFTRSFWEAVLDRMLGK